MSIVPDMRETEKKRARPSRTYVVQTAAGDLVKVVCKYMSFSHAGSVAFYDEPTAYGEELAVCMFAHGAWLSVEMKRRESS